MSQQGTSRPLPRFRGQPASARTQHLVAAAVVGTIAAIAVAGVVSGVAIAAFFAVGAGAGYSLSGSV